MNKFFFLFISISIALVSLLANQGFAFTSINELDQTRYQIEYHVLENHKGDLSQSLKTLGIDENSEITAYDIEKTDQGVVAQARATGLTSIKNWATSHFEAINSTYCLVRLSFNSAATGWVLYRFYDLTYLHPSSLIVGAAMAGTISLTFMAYSIPLDQWIMKSRGLAGQFLRYTFLSIVYLSALKTSYLTTEMAISGTSILTASLLKGELLSMFKAITASAAPMLFTFWNAYRRENREASIQASLKTTEEKTFEVTYQRVISKTTAFFSSIVNNAVGLVSSTTSMQALDLVSYGLTLSATGLFFKEHRVRSKRMKTCVFALQDH